eukprot:8497362-Pyramimonas_sp.AAC.1
MRRSEARGRLCAVVRISEASQRHVQWSASCTTAFASRLSLLRAALGPACTFAPDRPDSPRLPPQHRQHSSNGAHIMCGDEEHAAGFPGTPCVHTIDWSPLLPVRPGQFSLLKE